ncbi:MAG: UDP-N-acetylglucosamine 1-carboxyvinyltransferase [Planctomycetaceae bacterium]
MDMLKIQGGCRITGTVSVDGAKNAALPMMAAALAVDGTVTLQRIPRLVDVSTMSQLLQSLGADVRHQPDGSMQISPQQLISHHADYDLVRRMRAGICVLGPLLARCGRAQVSLPGGCNIGHRPIDLHLKGLAALGADLQIRNGYVIAEAKQLKGADIHLGGPGGSTVTGTCNVMVAAALASGQTIIRCAAREPEVTDLGTFLNSAGARIEGLGTHVLEIHGVDRLAPVTHQVIPDRIEAATLAIAAAATGGQVTITNAVSDHLGRVLEILTMMNVRVQISAQNIDIIADQPLASAEIVAEPFPGIPTDTQAQLMALLCAAQGTSVVRDDVFPERVLHAAELLRMGAQLRREGSSTIVIGGHRLTGASVMASDLRASAALVIAGLMAEGETTVRRIYHLDRGYADLEGKLNHLGARIQRLSDPSPV